MKTIHRFVCLLTAVMLMVGLASCGASFTPNPDASVSAAAQDVLTQYGASLFEGVRILSSDAEDEADRIDEALAPLYFGSGTEDIDMTRIADYAIAETAYAKASQFGVIRAASESDTEMIRQWLMNRSVRVAGDFSSYLPEEKSIADGWEVRTAGCFVYYCASRDNASVFSVMEKSLSGAE